MTILTVIQLVMLFISSTSEQVVTTPTGPLYIPINTLTSINCSVGGSGLFREWIAMFSDGTTKQGSIKGPISTGIEILESSNTFSSIIVNTIDLSLMSLNCTARDRNDNNQEVTIFDVINITIYPAPDPPDNLLYVANDNSIYTSWMLDDSIEQIRVLFHLSLLFHEPSKITSQRLNVSDVQSYSFSIEGVRSCDYFTFCVRASNDAGLGNESCINGNLVYIPTEDNIDFSLSRAGENFTLIVIVMIPSTRLMSIQNLSYVLEVMGNNDNRRSDSISANSTSYLQEDNLLANSSYMFRIESQNCNNSNSSVLIDFITSDIQGINVCSTNEEGVYLVSCDYAIGSNLTGCRYQLTSKNAKNISGKIMKDNTETQNIPDIKKYENIIIADINGAVLFEKKINDENITSCSFITDPTRNSTATTSDNSGANNGILAAIIVPVILVPTSLILVIVISVVVCLHCNGYCLCQSKPVLIKSPIDGRPAESNTLELNGREQAVTTSDDIDTAGIYNELKHEANTVENYHESEYSQTHKEPVYFVLEKEPPLKSEDISADPDAPAVPPFCPSGGDTPPVSEVQQTTSTTADLMYAEIGNIRAKK